MEQKIDLKQIERVLDELAKVKGSLITILQKTQDIYGYLPKDAIIYISELMTVCSRLSALPASAVALFHRV